MVTRGEQNILCAEQDFDLAMTLCSAQNLPKSEQNSGRSHEASQVKHLAEPRATTCEDILQWWAERAAKYPNLSRAVRAILCTPASSATSERTVSAAGFTISKRLCSLSPENLDKQLFVQSASGLSCF